MQWAPVFALLLTTGIPSSIDGSQPASLLSTTDPPTADFGDRPTADNTPSPPIVDAPDDAHVVGSTAHRNTEDEDYDITPINVSKRHDTGDSNEVDDGTGGGALHTAPILTAPMVSVDAEVSSYLAGEDSPITSTTSSERPMEREASSSSYTFDETSREEDEYSEDEEDLKAPSADDDSRPAPYPQSSIGSQGDVESQALEDGSATTPTTNLTADLESCSSSELKTLLEQAQLQESSLNSTWNRANEAWEKRKAEAVEPNRIYEQKKKEWEELHKIAVEKKRTDTEFRAAEGNFFSIQGRFRKASNDFLKKKAEVNAVAEEKEDLPTWPAKKSEAERQQTQKELMKTTLTQKAEGLDVANRTLYEEWFSAETDANSTLDQYNTEKCDESTRASTPECIGYAKIIGEEKTKVENAKKLYDETNLKLENDLNYLEKLKDELDKLKAEIGKLQNYIDTKTIDKLDALMTILNGELEPKERLFNETKKQKDEAEAVLNVKRAAKEEAERSDGGISAQAAKAKALKAHALLVHAKDTKIEFDRKVAVAKSELDKTQTLLTAAQSDVQKLTDKLEEAKDKEAQASSISSTMIIAGLVVLVILVVIVVGVVWSYRKGSCCFSKGWLPCSKGPSRPPNQSKSRTPKIENPDESGDPLLDKRSQTPGTGKSNGERTKEPKKQNKGWCCFSKGSKPSNKRTPTPEKRTGSEASNPLLGKQNLTPEKENSNGERTKEPKKKNKIKEKNPKKNPKADKTPSTKDPEVPPGLPDLSTVPFIPGQEPFKIPAANFIWRGPMKRRTRWHGEPTHDFEGQTGVTHVDNIFFDPNANYATEIGPAEIMEDGGPPSDSNRSEWLNNLDEWEKGHKALLASQAAEKIKQAGGQPPEQPSSTQVPPTVVIANQSGTGTNLGESNVGTSKESGNKKSNGSKNDGKEKSCQEK